MQDSLTNQTQFSQEEPYLEPHGEHEPKPLDPKTPDLKDQAAPPQKAPLSMQMKILIGASAVLIVLVLVLLITSRNGSTQQTVEPEPTITPSTIPAAANPLLNRVDSLKAAHDTADPSENDLSFPPVSMDLRLDPPPRR